MRTINDQNSHTCVWNIPFEWYNSKEIAQEQMTWMLKIIPTNFFGSTGGTGSSQVQGCTKKDKIVPRPQSALQKAAVNDLKLGIFDQVEFVHFQNMWETSKKFRILRKK